jgi:hypothetical protein
MRSGGGKEVDGVGLGLDQHRLDVHIGTGDFVPGCERSCHICVEVAAGYNRRVWNAANRGDMNICDATATHERYAVSDGVPPIRAGIVPQKRDVRSVGRVLAVGLQDRRSSTTCSASEETAPPEFVPSGRIIRGAVACGASDTTQVLLFVRTGLRMIPSWHLEYTRSQAQPCPAFHANRRVALRSVRWTPVQYRPATSPLNGNYP